MSDPKKIFRIRWADTLAMLGFCAACAALAAVLFYGG